MLWWNFPCYRHCQLAKMFHILLLLKQAMKPRSAMLVSDKAVLEKRAKDWKRHASPCTACSKQFLLNKILLSWAIFDYSWDFGLWCGNTEVNHVDSMAQIRLCLHCCVKQVPVTVPVTVPHAPRGTILYSHHSGLAPHRSWTTGSRSLTAGSVPAQKGPGWFLLLGLSQ